MDKGHLHGAQKWVRPLARAIWPVSGCWGPAGGRVAGPGRARPTRRMPRRENGHKAFARTFPRILAGLSLRQVLPLLTARIAHGAAAGRSVIELQDLSSAPEPPPRLH